MATNLRVAYVLPGFCADEEDPCIPVITTFLQEMARHVEPIIYTSGYPHRKGSYTVHGITVHCTGGKPRSQIDKIGAWYRAIKQMEEDHRERPFNLVHAFWGTAPGYAGIRGGKKMECPSIVSLAGGEFAQFKEEKYGSQLDLRSRRLIRRSLTGATQITVGSDWLARKVPPQYQENLSTIPLGIDTRTFKPGAMRTGKKLLAVAALIPIKDYPTLLRGVAYARRRIPELTLSVVGWKENRIERNRIERLIAELELSNAVEILGEIHYSKMPAIYSSHDLFLHSSRYEAQGMAILEALATGMPVVSSDVGIAVSLPENLLYRFQPGNAEKMGELIVRSCSNTQHAEEAYLHAPKLMRKEFDVEKIVERFITLYNSNL